MRYIRCFITILFLLKGGLSFAVTTYSVGATVAANWYSTIALAYAACTGSPSGGYVIEIQSSYVTEAFPITLGNLTNLTSSVPLIIRPAATLTISGSASRLFILDGAHHVTFDGRVGSSGAGVWTIDNTSTTTLNYAIQFVNDANNITIKYCTIKGRSDWGCIYFAGTSGTTGNDNNTIDNCTIKPSSGATLLTYGIVSYGTSTKENSGITVSNCNIEDAGWGIYIYYYSNNFTISGNSFYLTTAMTPTYDFVSIYCYAPLGGHTISSNYFGGRSASCGGSALTLNSSNYGYYPIYFASTVTGSSVTINSNVIKNINITSMGTQPFSGIDLDGSCNYSVGSSSATANSFGDTLSGTGNIVLTSTSTNTLNYIFYGITIRGSGTNSVKYNKFGSISIGGTATGTCYNILTSIKSTAGVTTVDNNTYGNSTAANISCTGSVYAMIAIYTTSNSNAIITNNIIRNFSQTGTGTPSLVAGDVSVIETLGTGTYTISGNKVGSTTSNNMVFATNLGVHGIHISGASNVVSSNNIIQGFNCTGTGTGAYFHGFCHSGGTGTATYTQDTIKNINMAGTMSGSSTNHTGFNIYSSTNGQVITKCGVYNMAHTNTTFDLILTGIWTAQSTGNGTISKCHISGLTTASTHASATISGIRMGNNGSTDAWTVSNNVVLLDGGTTSPELNGIKNGAWTGAHNIYHNTIKIYGTPTSGSGYSSTIFSNITSGSTYKNNICQNLRVNGGTATGRHYTFRTTAAGTFDYNYLETTAAPIARYNGVEQSTIANWRTASGASANEITHSGTGISIEMVKGFTSNSQIVNKGLYFASVTDDKEGISRTNPGPWMGAFEQRPTYLPIELISFEAVCNDKKTDLIWITASETNNDYFTLEYSLDAINFTTLDHVKGSGSSSGKKYYYYSDHYSPKNCLVYYRITQTDFDKKSKSFNLISRKACNQTVSDFDLIVYYKPLETELNYQFNLKKDGQVTIELWNLAGQILQSQTITGVKGDNHYSLDMSKCSKSMYLFKISDGQNNKSEKIIIE